MIDLASQPLGFGAFKIGRNQKIKYPTAYDLPSEAESARLLNAVLDLGIGYIDTAPAYGLSEERIGQGISHRRQEYILSTKVGEQFIDGESHYDFSAPSINASLDRSLALLQTDYLDIVLIHSSANDVEVLQQTDVVEVLQQRKAKGDIGAIGLSGKTIEAATLSLEWADLLMVEYHLEDRSHEPVILEASKRGMPVVVKKGLSAGHLSPREAIRFLFSNPYVTSLVVGSLNLEHLQQNLTLARQLGEETCLPKKPAYPSPERSPWDQDDPTCT
ncbi:General stress protein 69 [Polystyrenella longa]|uniref:General stress protein 69 n=1 Tax=Polystyrenella longa TaxID=2528007 RepID=A0A518CHX9_9PLAN|nr:aldo/keto reductase [Polystyrenella longa]QDU78838.1 General stress protein 69 [Polystyrenella longa]